ncbi:hypothetical protein EVAR_6089_1 [Eumeta japonica]|uniref:Uncharacterized protein n=1 Tax=Eumeta variegata TaxID=151549 RepID=A0A4C1TF81_EUMVA|nr:hypothetical protein EVAR_6089_1 [Eumeta japonica]
MVGEKRKTDADALSRVDLAVNPNSSAGYALDSDPCFTLDYDPDSAFDSPPRATFISDSATGHSSNFDVIALARNIKSNMRAALLTPIARNYFYSMELIHILWSEHNAKI